MSAYASVEEYRTITGDETNTDTRIEAFLNQQSAKLRAECALDAARELTEDQKALAVVLVCDAARKALVPVSVDGISDITGASQASFSANGFQSSVTLSNPSGAAYFDRSTLRAFKKSLRDVHGVCFVEMGVQDEG